MVRERVSAGREHAQRRVVMLVVMLCVVPHGDAGSSAARCLVVGMRLQEGPTSLGEVVVGLGVCIGRGVKSDEESGV